MMAEKHKKFVLRWTFSYLMKLIDKSEWEARVTVDSITELMSKRQWGGKRNTLVQKWRNTRNKQTKEVARLIEDVVCTKEGPAPEARRYMSELMQGEVFMCDNFTNC